LLLALASPTACGDDHRDHGGGRPAPQEPASPPARPHPVPATDPAPAADAAPPSPPAAPALATTVLEGPYPTLAAYCTRLEREGLGGNDQDHDVTCDPAAKPLDRGPQRARLQAPFREARIFSVEALDLHCQLGIRTDAGWFVLPDAVRCLGERAKSTLVTRVAELAVADVIPGAPPELRLRLIHDQSTEEYSPDDFERAHFEVWRLCGAGAGGAPRCTREIPISGRLEQHGSERATLRFELTVTPGPDHLSIAGDTSVLDRFLIDPLDAGDYHLVLP
jgi:hypothetical protein